MTDVAQSTKTKTPALVLTGKDRRSLRALGHSLKAVVQIGKAGTAPGVIEELKRALHAHELIKVRLLPECPLDRAAAGEKIAGLTSAVLIQSLGSALLFYKPHPKKPKVLLEFATEAATPSISRGATRSKRLPPSRGARRGSSPRAATTKKKVKR
jgi:RNA-binding protein